MPEQIRIAAIVGSHGRGSNMQAVIDACSSGAIAGRVELVVAPSDKSPALERAVAQGISSSVILYDPDSPESFDRQLVLLLEEHNIDLVILAGFMRRLGQDVVRAYSGRIMNIHPALIPSFCGRGMWGRNVHQAVIESGVRFSGCTVHFVDEQYDTGPIILQKIVPVEQDDTPETVAARVLEQEHKAYVEAVALFAEGRLTIQGRRVRIA